MTAANILGTPLHTDAEMVTPVPTPGSQTNLATPDLQQFTSNPIVSQHPSSTCTSMHASVGSGTHASPLFSSTPNPGTGQSSSLCTCVRANVHHTLYGEFQLNNCNVEGEEFRRALECSQREKGELQSALLVAEAAGVDVLQGDTSTAEACQHEEADLASLQETQLCMLAQAQETGVSNGTVKEAEASECSKATAQGDALAQTPAAVAAARSVEIAQLEAFAARQEVDAVRAEIKALQVWHHQLHPCAVVHLPPYFQC